MPDPSATPASASHEAIAAGALASVGLLLTAGLISTINRRRRRQLHDRPTGQLIIGPDQDAQRVETALRTRPEPLTIQRLDEGLRAIAAHCLEADTSLPILAAARVADDRIDLLLTQPTPHAPEGIEVIADGSVWTIHANHIDELLAQPDADRVAPPYPTLVTLGRDETDAHILIDLETAAALTICAADDDLATSAIAGIALELALAPWAGEVNLTLVGNVCAGLEDALQTPTVTRVHDVDDLLRSLRERAEQQRELLADDNSTVGQNRLEPALADSWGPELVLLDTPLTGPQADDLAEILTRLPRVAIAAVITGHTDTSAMTEWTYTLADGVGRLQPHDWKIAPQLVDTTVYRDMLELLTTSATLETEDAPWWDHDTTEIPTLSIDVDERGDAGSDQDAPSDPGIHAAVPDSASATVTLLTRAPLSLAPMHGPDPATLIPLSGHGNAATDELDTAAHDREGDRGLPGKDVGMEPGAADPVTGIANIESASPLRVDAGMPHAATPLDVDQVPEVATLEPTLRILGTVELVGARGEQNRSPRRCQELLLYVQQHPGSNALAIADQIGVSRATVHSTLSYLRHWLGTDDQGTFYLDSGTNEGYRLDPRVTTDWDTLRKLVDKKVQNTATTELVRALKLVRGMPFQGSRNEFGWTETQMLRSHITSLITDIALVVTDRALARRDVNLARWAAGKALLADPESEQLLTALARAEYVAGNTNEVTRLAARINRNARRAGVDLCEETLSVLEQIAVAG